MDDRKYTLQLFTFCFFLFFLFFLFSSFYSIYTAVHNVAFPKLCLLGRGLVVLWHGMQISRNMFFKIDSL